MALRVQAANHDDLVLDQTIEHPIGEAAQEESPSLPMDDRCRKWVSSDHLKARLNRCQKVFSEPGALVLIPSIRPFDICGPLPVEGWVASTTGSDLPQNLIPGDAKVAALVDVPIQFIEPPIELCALFRGHRDIGRRPREAIPQSLKEIEPLLGTEPFDLDRCVAHNPILSPVALSGNDGEQWGSPAKRI